jgi:2-polyprenyl-3-methyl-5-hydroxy-6-metoxy-1,4-benzoquinol methylase
MNPACPSCTNEDLYCVGDIADTNLFAGRVLPQPLCGGQLFRCLNCNLYFRYPRLNKEQLKALYEQGEEEHWHNVARERKDWEIASAWVKKYLPQGKILDVGCFDGGFLQSLGDRYKHFGVEIHPAASQRARGNGITILGADFEVLDEITDKFEAVVAIDVIEHVSDPLSFLRSLANVTQKGGLVILATGNTEAFSWKIMGSHYNYCAIAEHISFISPQWCQEAATRSGLKLEHVKLLSHSPANVFRRTADLGKNIFFRLSPSLSAWLRQRGVGKMNVKEHAGLAFYPPTWPSAKDHFVSLFRKY